MAHALTALTALVHTNTNRHAPYRMCGYDWVVMLLPLSSFVSPLCTLYTQRYRKIEYTYCTKRLNNNRFSCCIAVDDYTNAVKFTNNVLFLVHWRPNRMQRKNLTNVLREREPNHTCTFSKRTRFCLMNRI